MKRQLPFLGWLMAILLGYSPWLHAAVENWTFKGQKDWYDLTGQKLVVDYAQATVGDDTLAILYEKQSRQWYIQFTYIGDKKLIHTKSAQPEFFVRTLSNSGSGRYDSDYVINRKAQVFYNDPGKPQHVIMELAPADLPALKVGLDMGAGYFISSGCKQIIETESCRDLGIFRTYLFPGVNVSNAIEQIERSNGLAVSRSHSKQERKEAFKEQKDHEKTAKLLKWYQGDWAQISKDGPLFGGCDARRTIDYDRFPNLMQNGGFFGGKFNGILAISASGSTQHDHLYFSSAYPYISQGLPTFGKADTKKIPLFTEQGQQYYRLRLGAVIPGIDYKRIIDTDGKILRLSAWDTGGKTVPPMYFERCK